MAIPRRFPRREGSLSGTPVDSFEGEDGSLAEKGAASANQHHVGKDTRPLTREKKSRLLVMWNHKDKGEGRGMDTTLKEREGPSKKGGKRYMNNITRFTRAMKKEKKGGGDKEFPSRGVLVKRPRASRHKKKNYGPKWEGETGGKGPVELAKERLRREKKPPPQKGRLAKRSVTHERSDRSRWGSR